MNKIMTEEKQRKIYMFLTAIFVFMGIILLFVPDQKEDKELSPRRVLKEYNQGTANYSTAQIAKLIMENNPKLQLVDVRSEKEFNEFALQNAINIPLSELFKREKRNRFENSDILKPTKKITVFYSNGDVLSAQAWTLAKRLHLNNVYIMKGGLNEWVKTIMRPAVPNINTATPHDYALYSFYKAASIYFGGGSSVASSTSSTPAKKTPVKRKKKVQEDEGGC